MPEKFNEYGSILPCGGRGTRLESINRDDVPKSLFRIAGKELIRYSIDALPSHLVRRLVFAVDYKADEIRAWTRAMRFTRMVEFSEQTEPGVLGAIVSGAQHVKEDSMITCNTDEIRLGLKLADVLQFHETQGALATMVTAYSDKLFRHRLVETNDAGIITRTQLEPEEYRAYPDQVGLVNTGLLIIEKQAMEYFDSAYSHGWSGIIDPLCEAGQLAAFVNDRLYYFNVGTPGEYQEAERFLEQHP